jgi:hopanoid biosynthesis associated radical SAM protein HpnH
MGVPLSQMWTVASYVVQQKLRGRKRYPLVLMLEPLFRCNLACSGCGKIQHPAEILKKNLSPEDCFAAVEECGAPIVSIPGGEPLLHPQIDEIVAGLVQRKKYVYLCTNAILLAQNLHRFRPSKFLTFSIHLDGLQDEHDAAVCRDGIFDVVVDAIRQTIAASFRVTTNTTLFDGADPARVWEFFDLLMDLGVEGMTISPGYPYEKAPDQENFLHRKQTVSLFRRIFSQSKRSWRFNQSPLFLEFLKGRVELACTPWGNPTYNVFGWQKPCYLLQEGYCDSFDELLDTTDWDGYGPESGNTKCTDCMVHSGFEATAVDQTFSSLKSLLAVARLMFGGAKPTELGPDDLGPAEIPPPHIDVALGELTMNNSVGSQPKTAHESSCVGERSA